MSHEKLEVLRSEISANDRRIVEAVNERLRLVGELWELKQVHGLDRLDPDRERRLREELSAANTGPLSGAGLEDLVSELLGLTKRELDRD